MLVTAFPGADTRQTWKFPHRWIFIFIFFFYIQWWTLLKKYRMGAAHTSRITMKCLPYVVSSLCELQNVSIYQMTVPFIAEVHCL
jgi:hypothetical protein